MSDFAGAGDSGNLVVRMNISPQDFKDEWKELEPQQPRPSRSGFWVALAAAAFLLLGVCALTSFLWQRGALAQVGLPGDEPTPAPGDATAGAGANATPLGEATAVSEATAEIAATVTVPGTTAPPTPLPVTDIVVGRMLAPATLDAEAAEWAGVGAIPSAYRVFAAPEWDGSDDLDVSWQLAWDPENLYGFVTVVDDSHVQTQAGNSAFRGDSVELQIDTERDADFGPGFSPDDFQISLSPGDFQSIPPSAFRFQGTAAGDMLDATTPTFSRAVARPTDTGYVLEFAIPWPDLNMTPSPGLVLGVALNANDNDQPGTAIQEVLKSHVPTRRFSDPTSWGTLTLQ
jgi:hypothetical protein